MTNRVKRALRRPVTLVSALALIAAGGIAVGIAAPAGAAISGAAIDPAVWAAGSTSAATVSWTESAASSNPAAFNDTTPSAGGDFISIEVGWGWAFANANPTASAVTYAATWDGTAKSFTCATIGVTFSSPGLGTNGTGPQCLVRRSSVDAGNPGQQVVLGNTGTGNFTLSAASAVTVTFASGKITAPSTGPATDTWRIISLTTTQTTTVRTNVPGPDGTVVLPPPVTIGFDGNGGTCTPGSVTGEQGTWGAALTADKCTNGTKELAFFSTSPTAQIGAVNVAPGGPIYFLQDNRLYAIWRSDPPSPPTNVVATPGQNAVTVSWTASASNGGDPIRGYSVGYKATTDTNYRTFCNTNPVTFQCTAALPATNTKYTFVVSAANQVGRSESVPSSPVSPYDFKDVTASRGDVLFGLGGTKVDANGAAPGLAGQALNVQFKVGSSDKWTTEANAVKVNSQAKFTWSKRFPASANKKVVTVRFTYGADAVSGTYVLPRGGGAGDLSAPRNVKAKGELNRVALTWDPPKFDGGAKIIGYTICAQYIGTLCRDVGPAGQADFRNLLAGAEYSFTVAARTAARTGPKADANKKVKFTEASVRVVAREPGSITILAEGKGFPNTNTIRLEVAIVPTTNQPRDRWRWAEIETLAGASRFSKTVAAELGSSYDDQTIAVRLVTPLGSVYSKASRPPR